MTSQKLSVDRCRLMPHRGMHFVALSIAAACSITRGGRRNDAVKCELAGTTANALVKLGFIERKLVGPNTFYHITEEGLAAYKKHVDAF